VGTLLRVASGIVFVPILVWLSRRGGGPFLFFINMLLVVACWEFYSLMEAKGVNPSKKVGVTAVMLLSFTVTWSGTEHLGLFLAMFVIAITVRELMRAAKLPIYDIATTVFGVVYVGWLLLHLLLLRELPREQFLPDAAGSHFFLYAFFLAWASDTGAYFFGMAFGRHKLFPRVSPSKSIEGAIGGYACTIGAAFWGRAWFVRDESGEPYLTAVQTLVLALLVGVANQLGDLVESLLKRDAKVKDTAMTIPGHGGILDRFDSVMFAAPVLYYFLRVAVFR
jgi:phosphatidate cytidylyltransferase